MQQGSFVHTIDDIQERTSLPRHFINRCSSKISGILDPYRQYGDNNQLFYNDSGLMIWDHIGQLKRRGKTIPDIKTTLQDELQDQQNGSKTARQPPQNELENREAVVASDRGDSDHQQRLIDALEDAYQEVGKAKDEVIQSKEETINSLQQNLKLLTDGRDPQKVKEEQEKKIEEAAENREKIKQLKEEKRRQNRRQRKRRKRRQKLLSELESLEGKWFKRGRRQEILAELERLEQADPDARGEERPSE